MEQVPVVEKDWPELHDKWSIHADDAPRQYASATRRKSAAERAAIAEAKARALFDRYAPLHTIGVTIRMCGAWLTWSETPRRSPVQ